MIYKARRTPQFNSPAAWAEILNLAPTAAPLTQNETADVVIIGAGFAGLSAARKLLLSDPSLRISVLDALALGHGTAGRNSGFMIDLPHDLASDDYAGGGDEAALTALNRYAIRFAQDAVEDHQINQTFADLSGKVNGAATATGVAHNRKYAAHLTSLDEPSELLDAQAMFELTGSRHYREGLYTPGSLMLQPAGYIHGLGTGLRARGVKLFENSPVMSFEKRGGDWQVKTQQGAVTAPKVILANNGHLESFGISKGHLLQLFLFASMTPELDADQMRLLGGASRWGVTPSNPMGTTVRRIDSALGGNRIVTRTCAVVRPGLEATHSDVARTARVQKQKFDDRFPQLSDLKMEYAWAGHLCMSLNGVAVTRQVDDGIYAACVQNGLGTARGTLTGIAAAEYVLGHKSAITQHFEAEAAPKALPPQPFATWGANTYLRWKERQAGTE